MTGIFSKFARFLAYVIGSLLVLAFVAYTLFYLLVAGQGSDLAFQSSDGNWADSEVQFKGRDFEIIFYGFIRYKHCSGKEVVLERLTSRPSKFSIEDLLNDYDEVKWKIPVGQPKGKAASGGFDGFSPCKSNLNYEEIRALANKYIEEHT